MTRWTRWLWILVGISVVGAGCGAKSSGIGVVIAPTTATVFLNNAQQFTDTVTGSTNGVTWTVNGVSGGNSTIGTISTAGLYTAPAAIPTGTTITVTVTVDGTSESDNATVALSSGVTETITPTSATIGTSETLPFAATVTGVPFNAVTSTCNSANANSGLPLCSAVTWTLSGSGTINATTGLYTAPSTASTNTITATSIYDTSVTESAVISVVAVADPTITSVSPKVGALGAVFQDIYLTGTNFISSTNVFINGVLMPTSAIASAAGSSTALRVRVPDVLLSSRPVAPATTVTLTVTAARQSGAQQQCSPDPTQCQVTLSTVRAAIVGTSPDSVPQSSGSNTQFQIDGGFFGSPSNPTVITQFAGQTRSSTISSTNPDRQLRMTLTSADVSTPGLFPVSVLANSAGSSVPPVVANLAVQPSYGSNGSGPSAVTQVTSPLPVGTMPTAVAINTATGMAVVANQGSDDITLIDLTQTPPRVVVPSLCTGAVGLTSPCPAGSAAPLGVAVDNIRNIALVANSANNTVAVVNLATRAVVYSISTNVIGGIPAAVGINPVSGRAIVAYRGSGAATLLDLTPWPQTPAIAGSVSVSTGGSPRIAVSPTLDWALVSPGGLGSLSVVDLSEQTVTPIVGSGGASRSAGTVTITTTQSHALNVGETVLIQGVADPTFDGITTVVSTPSNTTFTYTQTGTLPNSTSGGGTASYALPVFTEDVNVTVTGIGLNDQTGKAILADPNGGSIGTVFSALDQSAISVALPAAGYIGAAFNPLDNIAVMVNELTNEATIIDPVAPTPLTSFPVGNRPWDVAIDPGTNMAVIVNQVDNTVSIFSLSAIRPVHILQSSPTQVYVTSTLTSGASPVAQTLSIVGKGFTGGSVVSLDGTALQVVSVSDRTLTATVPASMQLSPRRYTLQVSNGGVLSNAASFTVVQSVDVSGTCGNSSPTGVAVDAANNIALVTDEGCNDVYLVNLATGMGQIVAVGTNPIGVAVQAQGELAAVANAGSGSVSLVDDVNADVTATITTDAGPSGVAIDSILGDVAVAASGSNTLDVFSILATTGTSPSSLSVQEGPGPVAVNSTQHVAAVGNETSSNVSIVDLTQQAATSQTTTIAIPQGIVFDPVAADFLVAASLQNDVEIVAPGNTLTALAVGINPTSLAYNFQTSTLVTANSLGESMTVVDFLSQQVRAVFRLTPATQYSVDIHPLTNLAVVADVVNKRVLLLPLPR